MKFSGFLRRKVRVRFAPSPTGQLHIGGLRTAFFNFLFAKKHKGDFILRVEDTDRTRFVEDAQEKIYTSLYTYGLIPDEGPREGGAYGPYEQSKRLEVYRDAAEHLIDNGTAYRCFCSESRLEMLRKEAARRGEIPKYDRKCAHLEKSESRKMAENGEKFVVRFKLDKQNVTFQDEVFGHVSQHIDESDPVLMKSDGFPTYHLANVVDDRKMEISHVIRGMEWLSSTGKHRVLYSAFDWTPPKIVHLSLIMRSATKKLSKRDKDAFVAYYAEQMGVLPDAVLNLMIRNGAGIRDFQNNHFYTLPEMIENFDLELLGRRNLLLDGKVLEKYSRMAFKSADFETKLYPEIVERFRRDRPDWQVPDKEYLRKVVSFLRSKEENFGALTSLTRGEFAWFFTSADVESTRLLIDNGHDVIAILKSLHEAGPLTPETLKKMAETHRISPPKLLEIVRIALIGTRKGPPISELVEFFDDAEVGRRLAKMVELLENK